ncbi:hypothetical protein [Clostridium akagii]|uniref:hypothetical protein n=1 Tax=Clostridium akagii TaxID=91623 RepID=UPI00047A0E29|nr:hypothetical protein [Clostridium akagii]
MSFKQNTSNSYRRTSKDGGNKYDKFKSFKFHIGIKSLTIKLIPIVLIIISISLYENLYSIKYNDLISNVDLKNKIKILEKSKSDFKYSIYGYADSDNYRYALLLINDKNLGVIQLKKGINNKYKIVKIEINNSDRTEIGPIGIESPSEYGGYLIYGSNVKHLTMSTSITIDNQIIIESKVPYGDYFISFLKVYSSNNKLNILTDFNLWDKDHNRVNNYYHQGNSSISCSEDSKATYYLIFICIIIALCLIFINIFKLLDWCRQQKKDCS